MQETTQIVTQQQTSIVGTQSPAATPAAVLMYAMEKGADMAQTEKLMDLQIKWEANEARKAYVADMAEFKKNPPTIVKDKLVAFSGTSYTHATLGNVTSAIVEGLAKYGFSHRWDVDQQGAQIIVSCVLTHKLGHSERTTLSSGKDDSGKKNAIQQVASAVTYLQRYTLLAATGLATHDQEDDDGRGYEVGVTLAEKWCGKAITAKTVEALGEVWAEGATEIGNAKDVDAYTQFKAVCNKRKSDLDAPKSPARSSRVASIVGSASDEDSESQNAQDDQA